MAGVRSDKMQRRLEAVELMAKELREESNKCRDMNKQEMLVMQNTIAKA